MHCCECQLFKAQTSMANEYNSSLAIQRTLLPDFGCEMSGRWHKRQWFAYLLGDTERGGDALRGGDLLPLRAGLRDLDADLEADLQLNHASCHTQDALTEIANAQHVRRQRSTAGAGREPTADQDVLTTNVGCISTRTLQKNHDR